MDEDAGNDIAISMAKLWQCSQFCTTENCAFVRVLFAFSPKSPSSTTYILRVQGKICSAQAPLALSSSRQPANPWALYLKVQSLVQTTAESWAIAADETNVHQILCLLMELWHLKERLDDAMEKQNYLQDALALIDLLSQLYEE
ncbi:hypothetical protein BS17DRAFT_769647 [Gyrodon lividus]|nr:hypothetical protein BS17DRAFT_769647 [Gyrodon lividus]